LRLAPWLESSTMINQKHRLVGFLILFILCLVIIPRHQETTAQQDSSRPPYNSLIEQSPSVFLPFVTVQYGWPSIDRWTPWAFEEQTIQGLYSGPEPGWYWTLSQEGLFRSKDNVETWDRVDGGLPRPPSDLAVDQGAFPNQQIYATANNDIYASEDGGENWTLSEDLAVDFNYIDYVNGIPYAASSYPTRMVYKRLANGVWSSIGNELPEDGVVRDLEEFQSTLFAGTSNGLYSLRDNTWQPVTISEYENDMQNPTVWLDAWLQESVQFTFSEAETSLAVNSIAVYEDTILIGVSGARGVYRSNDGISWIARDVGLIGPYNHQINSIAASDSGRFYAAGLDGVFVSDNMGDRWETLDLGLPHTNKESGVLLDGATGTSLALVRDLEHEQTIGAVFDGRGLWYRTVTDETLLQDQPSLNPPKAVLVVGPVDPPDHDTTMSYIAWADRLADIMTQNGMQVVKIYWPDSTWENVRPALSGASIVVYKGHGFGIGDVPEDVTETYGGLNGFCLVDPMDPSGARLGTQDMLVTTNRLAENAIVFFFCCSCGGSSGGDTSPVAEALARRRIEAYSVTSLYMGGGGYFSSVNEENLLLDFFANPDKTLGELYESAGGPPDNVYPHVLWPELSVWFDGNAQEGWGRAFAGNPNLTARDVLGLP